MTGLCHLWLVSIPTVEQTPTVDLWPTAARAVGIGKTVAYERAATGQLTDGVPIIRVGTKWRVPTAALRRALCLDEPDTVAS